MVIAVRIGQAAVISCLVVISSLTSDADQIISELQVPGIEGVGGVMPINEAFHIEAENVLNDNQEVAWREECVIHYLDERHWRIDSIHRFPEPVSYCRDNDLWFVVIDSAGVSRFDRLGFDAAAAHSVEASIRTRAEAIFDATHVLELPVGQFVTQEGITIGQRGKLTNAQSQKGVQWDLEPPAGTSTLRAHGALEWRTFDKTPRITHLRYAFGKRPAPGETTASGIEINLEYDLQSRHAIPILAVRTDQKSAMTTVIKRLSAAEADLAYYSPSFFGLERPGIPIPRWAYYLTAAAIFAGTALVAKTFRLRPR